MLHSIQSWVVSHLVTPTCISTGVTSLTSDCLKGSPPPRVPRKRDSYSKLIEKNLKVLKGIGLKSYLVSMVIFPLILSITLLQSCVEWPVSVTVQVSHCIDHYKKIFVCLH